MCWRFHTGSNRPFRFEQAVGEPEGQDVVDRLFAEGVVDRKTCDSSKIACTVFGAWAEGRSVPNGFSMMTSRPVEAPIARSASSMAAASGAASAGSALANEGVCWNACQAAPMCLLIPNSAIAWRARSGNCSSVRSLRDDR